MAMRVVVGKPRAWRLARASEAGAIAVIMTIMLGTGVLLGLLALTVDAGSVYLERGTVIAGADAATEALAAKCALHSTTNCNNQTNAATYAQANANANAADGLTETAEVCGLNTPTNLNPLTTCSSLTSLPRGGGCVTTPTASRAYARVTTKTKTTTGSTITTSFTNLLNGLKGNASGVTLWGCSQAYWGKVAKTDISLELALPPCSYSNGGIVKLRLSTGGISALSACGFTSYSNEGGTVDTSGFATSMGSGAAVQAAFSPSFAAAGTCATPFSMTATGTSGTGTTYTRESAFSAICGGTILTKINSRITAGTGTYEPVPIGIRATSNSTMRILTFVGVKFLASCTGNPGSANVVCPPANLVGANGTESWGSACSATQPCLRMQFGNIVEGRGIIDWTAAASLPNMGVQAVQMLP